MLRTHAGDLEKSLAECIVDSELETESKVVRRLKLILDKEIQEISTLKRNVSRTLQEYASITRNYEVSSNNNKNNNINNYCKLLISFHSIIYKYEIRAQSRFVMWREINKKMT